MSIKVELEDLSTALSGTLPEVFLLTTSEDMSPHPANVSVDFAENRFTVSAGRRSCANCEARPTVTLMWPNQREDHMSLLVDGVATVVSAENGVVAIEPTSAVWRRSPRTS